MKAVSSSDAKPNITNFNLSLHYSKAIICNLNKKQSKERLSQSILTTFVGVAALGY